KRNYRSALGEQRVPALFIAGRADRIAPADRVYSYYDAMGSTDKKFIVAGKAHGFSMDYGHLDYSLGRSAPAEIYPIVYDWLMK
ncbi:MAG: alpha/beta hydrolase, partial [Myxococcota bacterium]|nr:alpha/beta hydrolase [Myxococcota bacterium]